MNRRESLQLAAATVAASTLGQAESAEPEPRAKPKTIAMLLYPEFTALDLVGPHHVFSALQGFQVQLVARSTKPVSSDMGLTITPTLTLADCPKELAILFVPGGTRGTVRAMEDQDVQAFLKSRAANAEYLTSVCTGALVLGAAGLLRGYKATTHWGALDILKTLGAQPLSERVVFDRNRVTGGGVTAGIDFGLALAAKLKDEQYARWVQLVMEYAPHPPFKSGTPSEAGAELTKHTSAMFKPFVESATAAAQRAKARW